MAKNSSKNTTETVTQVPLGVVLNVTIPQHLYDKICRYKKKVCMSTDQEVIRVAVNAFLTSNGF